MRQEPQRTSPWVWIAAGCGGCLVLTVAATVAIVWGGYQFTQELVEDLENPQSREAKVLEILGAEELPEGYYPAMGISIPWITDVALLSGKPVEYERQNEEDSLDIDLADDDFGDRAFIYISSRTFTDPDDEAERFFTNRAGRAMTVQVQGIGVRARELLREGEIEVRGVPVRYRIDRGGLEMHRSEHLGRRDTVGEPEGLLIRFHFRCADAGRLRLGMWHGPAAEGALDEPAPAEAPAVEAPSVEETVSKDQPPAGLPTDEAALRDFLAHFDVCG